MLFVKYKKVSNTTDGMLSNLTVALAIYICVSCCGPITGAGLNPTFALAMIGSDLVVKSEEDFSTYPNYLVSYMIGPIIGGLFAAILLLGTHSITPEDVDENFMMIRNETGKPLDKSCKKCLLVDKDNNAYREVNCET